MTPVGLTRKQLFQFVRDDPGPPRADGQIVVVGTLAAQLQRALAAGGDASLVRVGPDATGAAAVVVCVLAGDPTDEQIDVLRSATRSGTPVVGVQTAAPREVPYLPALDVVDCPPGSGFPIDEIAEAIARVAGRRAAPLAAHLPMLRTRTVRHLVTRAGIQAAATAGTPWGPAAHLPLLVALQRRLLHDVNAAAGGSEPPSASVAGVAVRPESAIALGTGVVARKLVRSLPRRGAPVRALVAGSATVALGLAGAARAAAQRSHG